MDKRRRAIDAYRTESVKGEAEKKQATPTGERTGFLKLTKEKPDYSKIARFLLLLGKDEAVKVLRHLSPEEVETISAEISRTGRVDKVEAEGLLKEFGFDREKDAVRVRGGADAASEILTKAFGREEAEKYLRKAVPEIVEGPFSFLNDLNFDQLILLLKDESPQVVALVLRYLDPALSSRVISHLDRRIGAAVIKRIAKGGSISMEVITGMEDSLKEKIRTQGEVDSTEIDGTSALAGILKYMNIEEEQKILGTLAEENEEISRKIKEKLFTIDTVLHMDRNDLQKILIEFKDRDIAMMLRAVDSEVREKIRQSLSTGQQVLIDEENDLLGKVKKSDAEAKVREFLELLRKREEEGAFIILREEDDYL
ncbi:flagellar motor switch protein FliG [Spirochaeta isovalerica]|uniref:Flagellar motor switch protein FliG n=1 Tax=Spirochaeta isovalerica TaxID=150 RepID=A0A841RC52_9SPIO|nr:FliG C-terminal domain-containing protein [Spirochaeta isovalerica]MBB6480248.1 flagellar motor switch protein FliG [Spirochaeta isovalerica]